MLKKLLITILFLIININFSFAKDNPHKLAEELMKNNNKIPSNGAYSHLYKGLMNCSIYKEVTKNSPHLQVELCHSASGIGQVRITNKKTKESQSYSWDKDDILKLQLL